MSTTAWTPIWWYLSVMKLHHALTEAHHDNLCLRLYTSRPKMSVYQSAFGMTPFLCNSWALVFSSGIILQTCVHLSKLSSKNSCFALRHSVLLTNACFSSFRYSKLTAWRYAQSRSVTWSGHKISVGSYTVDQPYDDDFQLSRSVACPSNFGLL